MTAFVLLKYPYRVYQFVSNNRFRNEIISSIINKKEQNQISTYTKENRYPILFNIVKEYFEKQNKSFNELKVLSYGCSTGEEVKSINDYMPNAKITGIDINKWCINQAKKKYKNDNFIFVNYFDELKKEKYDVIFALAVFQHTINRKAKNNEKAQIFLFKDFKREIKKLDKLLNLNGLLIIDHTDFNFLDTKPSKNYKILNVDDNLIKRKRPYFNMYNVNIGSNIISRIYRKLTV